MTQIDAAAVHLNVPARTLVLVAGLPGAGKSTLLATLPPDPAVVVLDSDGVRDRVAALLPPSTPYAGYRWAVHLLHRAGVVRAACGATDTVVVHLPATAPRVRRAVLALARCTGRTPHLLWVHAGPDAALCGQRERGRVVRPRAFAGHVARAADVARTLRDGPPPGWASAGVIERASARRALVLDK